MERSPKIITAALFVSVLLGVLDTAFVVPTLTAIIREWSVSYQWGIWTITLYLFMFVMSMPVTRLLAHYVGRQFMLTVSLLLFGAGAVISGFSPTFSALLAGRLLQGIGGGGLLTLTAVVLSKGGITRRYGLVSVPLATGAILAFMLGSLLVTVLHWRWIFYIQFPLAFLLCVLILCKPGKPAKGRKAFDGVGLILFAGIALCLMVGFTLIQPEQFGVSVFSANVFPFIVVALGLIIPFIMVERQHDVPLIPLRYFYRQNLVLAWMSSIFSGMSWIALIFIPAFAENTLRLKPGAGGYMLAIFAVAAVVSVAITGLTTERYGAAVTGTTGFVLAACGFLLLGTLVSQFWGFVLAVILLGLGLGATIRVPFNPFTVTHYFRMVGMTTGSAVLVTFLTQATGKIPERVRDSLVATSPSAKEVSGGIFADLVEGSSQFMVPNAEKLREFIPDHIAVSTQELILRQIMRVMRETLMEGYQNLFVAAAVFTLIGLMCAMAIVRMERDEGEA